MKKIIIVSCLLVISFVSLYGQWYVKKYNVTDINSLSKEQLEESLGKSKTGLLYSGILAGLGGVIFLAGKYSGVYESENPTFFEELVGEKGMNDIAMVTGAGIIIGGTIAGIVHMGRIGRIKSVLNYNYPSLGSLNISPTVILNSYTHSFCPGFTLTYNF